MKKEGNEQEKKDKNQGAEDDDDSEEDDLFGKKSDEDGVKLKIEDNMKVPDAGLNAQNSKSEHKGAGENNDIRKTSSLDDRNALTGRIEGALGTSLNPINGSQRQPGQPDGLDGGQNNRQQIYQPKDENVDDLDNDVSLGVSEKDSMDDDPNIIVAQYKTEYRVRSVFKFNLQNVVMFIDGIHYFVKEMKS